MTLPKPDPFESGHQEAHWPYRVTSDAHISSRSFISCRSFVTLNKVGSRELKARCAYLILTLSADSKARLSNRAVSILFIRRAAEILYLTWIPSQQHFTNSSPQVIHQVCRLRQQIHWLALKITL